MQGMTEVRALSEAQYRAATRGGVPDAERVWARGDGTELWSVAVPMPGDLLDYTLSAILVTPDSGVTIVDPGWNSPETLPRLEEVIASKSRSLSEVRHIVVTHAHPDHLGAAEALRQESGATLMMHEREQEALDRAGVVARSGGIDLAGLAADWGVPKDVLDHVAALAATSQSSGKPTVRAEALLRDGERLPIDGVNWEVLSTPGHTSGHMCVVDREARVIFVGDHVLPTLFPGVGIGVDWGLREPGDSSPIANALASLDKLAPFDEYQVIPGHGYRFSGLRARRLEARNHIVSRAREVQAALAADRDASVWEVASGLSWSAGWRQVSSGPSLPSALLQTSMYVDFVHSGGLDGEPREGR